MSGFDDLFAANAEFIKGFKSQDLTGEADLIVAKHRNGPTRTITVSAQLHLARFTDMAANFAPTEKFVKDN